MSAYPDILTIEQAANLLQVSTRTIQRMVTDGRMPGRQVGSQWRFDREQIRAWVRGEAESPAEQEQNEHARDQRDLVERESLRLGVDVPETLLDMQQEYARRRAQNNQDSPTVTVLPEDAER